MSLQTCLNALEKRFTKSTRVQRLIGMRYEAEGKLGKAAQVYEEILEEDETNVVGWNEIYSLCVD